MAEGLLETYVEKAPLSMWEGAAYEGLAHRREGLKTYADTALFELHSRRLLRREISPHEADPLAEESLVGDEVVTATIRGAAGVVVPEVSPGRLVPEFASGLWYNRVEAGHLGLSARSRPIGRLALYAEGRHSTFNEARRNLDARQCGGAGRAPGAGHS